MITPSEQARIPVMLYEVDDQSSLSPIERSVLMTSIIDFKNIYAAEVPDHGFTERDLLVYLQFKLTMSHERDAMKKRRDPNYVPPVPYMVRIIEELKETGFDMDTNIPARIVEEAVMLDDQNYMTFNTALQSLPAYQELLAEFASQAQSRKNKI